MRVAVVGLGALGARAARQLASTTAIDEVVLRDQRASRVEEIAESLGDKARPETGPHQGPPHADAVVLATSGASHVADARALVAQGVAVVSCSDAVEDVEALLDLGPEAEARGTTVVIGAAFSPGLTCVLAALSATRLDVIEEIHVARIGTGGPACARQHHRSLGGVALDWRDGGWVRRPAGSGRELCWFPDPVGAQDCYRASLPDALLLAPTFPAARRITARVGATRRDRVTARLPMLRPPHPEGTIGA
ncbi:MAG TPA: Gfo/Idh/MocA family oxidoreductase, partial [Acidimicrobiales bacterium]